MFKKITNKENDHYNNLIIFYNIIKIYKYYIII